MSGRRWGMRKMTFRSQNGITIKLLPQLFTGSSGFHKWALLVYRQKECNQASPHVLLWNFNANLVQRGRHISKRVGEICPTLLKARCSHMWAVDTLKEARLTRAPVPTHSNHLWSTKKGKAKRRVMEINSRGHSLTSLSGDSSLQSLGSLWADWAGPHPLLLLGPCSCVWQGLEWGGGKKSLPSGTVRSAWT